MSDLTEYWDGVDVDSVEAQSRPDPIPTGDYMLELSEQEIRPTKDGSGIMLNCKFRVVEGGYENRIIFANFNIRNKSAQAQQIGIGQFKSLCLAAGVPFETAKRDVTSLLHVPFTARIGLSKTTDQYPEPRNEVKAYRAAGGEAPASKAPATPAAKAAPATKPSGGLPWKKSA